MVRKLSCCALALFSAGLASAQQRYAQHSVPINAGVVIINSQVSSGVTADDTPHAWYNFDSNTRVKPAAWNMVNPAHPSSVTGPIAARWAALDPGNPPAVGQHTQKQDGAYWEVFLSSLTEQQLAEYDVLLLPAYEFVDISPSDREKLRRFMDKGGILWVDIGSSGSLENINNLPVPYALAASTSFALSPYWNHPLLSYPNFINQQDLANMPSMPGAGSVRELTIGDINTVSVLESGLAGDSGRLVRIAGDPTNGLMTLAVAKEGEGYEVITTQGVANTLNSVPGVANNRGYMGAAPVFNAQSDAVARLVVNMISLAGSYNEEGRGPRKANESPVTIDAPLLADFTAPGDFTPSTKGYAPPVLYKGLLVVSSGNILQVYDANPKQDLDGDGDPDDGVRDYTSPGQAYDLIWQSQPIGTGISPPTCIEVPNAPPGHHDQIWVTDTTGNLVGFDAFHFTGGTLNAVPPDFPLIAPPPEAGGAGVVSSSDGPGPYAPTYSDGLLFVSDVTTGLGSNQGRVWIANPDTATRLVSPSSQNPNDSWFVNGIVIPEGTGPTTVGYIPIQDNSGGSDRVVYLPTRANSSTGPNGTAGISSFWMGAKGERPQSVVKNGSSLIVAPRCSSNGLNIFVPDPTTESDPTILSLGPKLTVLDANGNPEPKSWMESTFGNSIPKPTNGAPLTFTLTNPGNYDDTTMSVRLDYTIDWSAPDDSISAQILRGQLFLPDEQTTKARRILNSIALSPQGTMDFVFSTQDPSTPESSGGSYYAIREEGRGQFRVLTRWDLYDAFNITLNGSQDILYPATINNRDPVTQLFPFLSSNLVSLTFISSPVISNGIAYVTAEGMVQSSFGNIPNTIVLAFKAEPDVVELKTGDLGTDFTILQPNLIQSTNKLNPEAQAITLLPSQYVYEKQPGSDYGLIRIDSLSNTRNGELQNVFNLSMPVIIQKTGSPDTMFEPDRNGSRWSPLLWYTVFTGVGNTDGSHWGQTGPPFIAGNTLFMPSTSVVPSFLTGSPFVPHGVLYAMNTDIASNDPFLSADPNRPWLNQLFQLSSPPGTAISLGNILPNPDFVWPQTVGVSSFSDYTIRVLQATLTSANQAYGIIGGNGKVYAWSNNGLWSFSRADFTIADESRAAELDSVGNPIWSTDLSLTTGPVDSNGAGNIHPIVHPVRAYPFGQDETLVVDSGSDRLTLLDHDGREVRSMDRFVLDNGGYVPEGYRANEPLTFSRPQDVASYTSIVTTGNPLVNPQPAEYWQHYLVADTGNNRLVDIVDRYAYDPASGQIGNVLGLGVLYWHSPEIIAGKKYSYTSVARIFTGGAGGTWKIAAAVTNIEPTAQGGGIAQQTAGGSNTAEGATGNGGIIVFDNQNTVVINQVNMPDIPANVLYTPDPNNELGGAFTQPEVTPKTKLLHALNSVSMTYKNDQLQIMFTDDTGVYEIGPAGGNAWSVNWMLPRTINVALGVTAPVYSVMRRTASDVPTTDDPYDFRPTYAKRMPSGDVLIVNGYVGRYRKVATDPLVPFHGEIIGVDGSSGPAGYNASSENLGFGNLSLKFEIPPVSGTRGLMAPTFADRR